MEEQQEFQVALISPADRRHLAAEIMVNHEQWAEVNQEGDELAVEIYPRRDGEPWRFPLASALEALERAKSQLNTQ